MMKQISNQSISTVMLIGPSGVQFIMVIGLSGVQFGL